MEIRDYLDIIKKRWAYVVAVTLTAVVMAALATLTMTPTYVAGTQVYVSVQGGSTSGDLAQGSTYARQQVSSYARLATTEAVLGPVIDALGLDTRADTLAKAVTAESPAGTSLIDITMTDPNPAMAAAIANSIAVEFTDVITELERPEDGGSSSVKLTVTRQAAAPESPASPNITLNAALALALGLASGIALALLRERLDTKVRDEAGLRRVTTASVVGAIAFDDESRERPLIVQSDPHSPRAEAFRRLRTNVQFLDITDQPHSVIVTSSLAGEGKSSTAINLAIALADSGTRVALIDADLRRPSVAAYMGLEGRAGLTTILIGQASYDDVVQPWGNGFLDVLTSGQIPPNPSELLGSRPMADLLDRLVERYDLVIVDTPPLLPVTDAAILSKRTGGALVVVGAGVVHRHQLTESLSALETVGARVLGLVLNREARKGGKSYEYYKYDQAPAAPARRSWTGRRESAVTEQNPPYSVEPAAPRPSASGGAPEPTTSGTRLTWPPQTASDSAADVTRTPLPPQHRR